jgi:hypothetical protein
MSVGVSEENPRSIACMVESWNCDKDMVEICLGPLTGGNSPAEGGETPYELRSSMMR